MMADVVSTVRNPVVLRTWFGYRERRHRDRSGTFLVEGVLEVERAIAAGAEVEQLVIGADHLGHADLPPGATPP